MNVSYQWLKAVAPDLTLSVEEMAERLAARGAPVEEVLHLGEGIKDVVVARVEEAGRHPNADRLSLCKVNAGGEMLQVVCGAPNVKAGSYYPFAPVGATLPGGLKLKKAKIRGEVSEGMLCSPIEIGLGTDSDGILELSGEPEIGAPLVEVLGLDDWRFDVEVTANRGDLLSHVGIAREVAPLGEGSVRLPEIPGVAPLTLEFERDPSAVQAEFASIRIDDPDLCSRYLGVVIRGVTIGPSPEWLQSRLRSVGARPINNVVDATNYVLLELGQPLHAFDLNKLSEGSVVVRRAREGEVVTTLDGVDRKLGPEMLAICDALAPIAIAGVMGGQESEVSEQTVDVLLECALFDPASTRSTRRALGMSTDASYRYERGVDPDGMERAIRRCTEIIVATAGGTPEPRGLDVQASANPPIELELRPSRIEQVLGLCFDHDQITALLTPLGFCVGAAASGESITVSVPGCRSYDVTREVDLIEEIARAHGFDAFPEVLRPFRPTGVPDHPLFALEERIRTLLIHNGAFELQTPAFVATGEIELPNPVSSTESHLRSSMVPGVLERIAYNLARGIRDVRLFEIGTVFFAGTSPEDKPRESTHLSAAFVGRSSPAHWSGRGSEALDLWDAKGWFGEVVRLAWPTAQVNKGSGESDLSWLADGPSLEAFVGDHRVGVAGAVRKQAIDVPPWAATVFAMEIALPDEPAMPEVPVYTPVPQFPSIERDLALLVPSGVTAAEVRTAIEAKGGNLLDHIDLFDLYLGEGIPPDTRSIAYRLTFRSGDRTLTDNDVEPAIRRVLKRLKEELNVHQRG